MGHDCYFEYQVWGSLLSRRSSCTTVQLGGKTLLIQNANRLFQKAVKDRDQWIFRDGMLARDLLAGNAELKVIRMWNRKLQKKQGDETGTCFHDSHKRCCLGAGNAPKRNLNSYAPYSRTGFPEGKKWCRRGLWETEFGLSVKMY